MAHAPGVQARAPQVTTPADALTGQSMSTRNTARRVISPNDDVQGVPVPTSLLYPTDATPHSVKVGAYSLDVAPDAPVAGGDLPLVVFSHGTGSSPWLVRDLACTLARAGFVVALPEHPGNNRSDDHLANTLPNLVNRPRHLRVVLDAAFADEVVGPRLSRGGVAVMGHSLGGYTALALAGGRPSAFAHLSPDGLPRPFAVERDTRVRALVLLAPATAWFLADGALAEVDVPIFLRTGELDELAPPFHGDVVARGIVDSRKLDHVVVPGAGHFAFVSPFPPEMTRPDFVPSHDPPGFDRAAYQPRLHAEILAFLCALH